MAAAAAFVAASLLGIFAPGNGARAASYDGDGVGATADGGPGLWNLTLNRWGAGPIYGPFTTGDTAVFGGTRGSFVVIDGPVSGNMDFQTSGYIVRTTTGGSFTWNSTASVNVNSGVTAEIRSALYPADTSVQAPVTLNKDGTGTLIIDGKVLPQVGTANSTFNINAGTVKYGQPLISTNSDFIGGKNAVYIAGGAVLDLGKHADRIGPLTGTGTVRLGSFSDNLNVATTLTSWTYGSVFVIDAENTNTSIFAPTNFAGNIVDDGLVSASAFMSGGRVVIGKPVTTGLGASVKLSGTNTFRGITALMPGSGLIAENGNAIPDTAPLVLTLQAAAARLAAPVFTLFTSETVGSLGSTAVSATYGFVDPAGQTLTVGTDNLNNEYYGQLGSYWDLVTAPIETGAGMITKVGTGTMSLALGTGDLTAASASAYSGKYTVKGGKLLYGVQNRMGGGGKRTADATPPVIGTNAAYVPDYVTLDGGTYGLGLLTNVSSNAQDVNRGISVTANGGGLYFNNPTGSAWSIISKLTDSVAGTGGQLTKSGSARIDLLNDNSGLTSDWLISDGVLLVGAPFSSGTTVAVTVSGLGNVVGMGNMAMGSGSVTVNGSILSLAAQSPGQLGSTFTTSTDQTYNIAGGAGEKFTFGPGATVAIGKNTLHSLAVTIGGGGTSFQRAANGSLLILANTGVSALGTATGEKLLVNGTVSTVATNGGANSIMPAVMLAQNTTVAGTEGSFATYGGAGTGIVAATMSPKTDINTANNTDAYQASAGKINTLSANTSAYAVKIGVAGGGQNLELNGKTLSLGNATTTDPAMLIINKNSVVSATGGGTLAFGNHEALVYSERAIGITGAGGTIYGNVTGSQGLTKAGYGAAVLDRSTTLNYTGNTRIEHGAIIVGADNQLPAATNLIFSGTSQIGGAAATFAGVVIDPTGGNPALRLSGRTVSVNSVTTEGGGNGILSAANQTPTYSVYGGGAIVDLGDNGVLKITGSGASTFNGQILRGANSTSSTVWMAGPGSLTFGLPDAMVTDRGGYAYHQKLWATNGGTVNLELQANSWPVAAASAAATLPDAFKLDNGTITFKGLNATGLGTVGTGTNPLNPAQGGFAINANRGITIGAGGGTIEVESAYLQVLLNGGGSTYGSGTLTKTGAGVLYMPTTPSLTAGANWKLNVKGGQVSMNSNLQKDGYYDSTGLGPVPATFDPTNITLDGGMLDSNVTASPNVNLSTIIDPNRGIFVGPGGGQIQRARGAVVVGGPLSGSGPLRLSFPGQPTPSPIFQASSDGTYPGATAPYTGTVTIASFPGVLVSANNALGTGTITNDPATSSTFGTQAPVPITLSNHFILNAGLGWNFSTANPTADLILTGQISGGNNWTRTGSTGSQLELANATNNFTGDVEVSSGSLVPTADGALGVNTARIVVDVAGSLAFKGNLNYASAKPVFLQGSGRTFASIHNLSDNNTFAGPVTLMANATFGSTTGTLTLTGAVAGASDSTLTKVGLGTVALAGANSYSGITSVQQGTLALASTGTINALSPLSVGGGELAVNARTSSVAFSATTVDLGSSRISAADMGVGNSLALGAITRNAGGLTPGGTVDFVLPANGTITTTTANANPAGGQQSILGGYATVGGSTWAVSGTGATPGAISGLASFDNTLTTPALDVSVDGTSSTTPGTLAINSLRFNNPAAYTSSGTGTLTVATGGILVTSTVGANNIVIGQDTLTANAGQDLIVNQNNAAGSMTISSAITGTGGLTKSGPGLLTVTGTNTFSGGTKIAGGTLAISSDAALAGTSPVFAGGTLQFNNYTSAMIFGDSNVAQAAMGRLTIGANSGAASTLSGIIAQTDSSIGLNYVGPGTLVLTATGNSFTGGTTISAGTLEVGPTATTGSLGNVDVSSGATFQVDAGAITGGIGTLTTNGTVNFSQATQTVGALAGSGTLNLTGTALTLSLGTANTSYAKGVSYNGNITGTGSLILSGGILTLGGTNSYSGGTTIATMVSGTVGANVFQSTLIGTTTSLQGNFASSAFAGETSARLVFDQATNGSFGGIISLNLSVTKRGSGTVTLTNANTYLNTTIIEGGTLRLGVANAVPSTSIVSVRGASIFDLNSLSPTIGGLAGDGSVLLSGALTAGGNNTPTLFSGVMSGSGSFVKAGTSMTTLSGINTYSGTTTVNAGVLAVSASNNLGNGSGTNSLAFGGGTLKTTAAFNEARNVALNTGGGSIDTDGNNVTFSGTFSGTGGLTKAGVGALTLTATNNYSGVTTVNGGTLVAGPANIGDGSATNNLAFNSGTLQLTGALSTARTITLNGAGGTIDAGANNTTFSGVISGTGSLTKLGSGTMAVSATNTNSGLTNVLGGTLKANAANTLSATSTVNVGAGATLDLNGFAQTIGGLAGHGSTILNGNLIFGMNDTSTLYSGVISGTGSLTKSNTTTATTVFFTGKNTYSGPTIINRGFIGITESANLGDSSPTNGLTLNNGGIIAYGTINSVARNITIGAATGTISSNGNDVTFGNVTGANTLQKTGAGTLTVNHFRNTGLVIAANGGTVKIAPNGTSTGTSVVSTLTIDPTTKLDLTDNKLVVQGGTVGTWNGSAYDGLTGLVQTGRNGGTWAGNGIVTSMSAAAAPNFLTSLAIASNADLGKTTFGGQAVTGTDVLIGYTYGGDANLSGHIDADDYFQIDSNYNKSGVSFGYWKGDFNYDGAINGDDYFIIDANYAAQTTPFGSGPALSGVTAVPEPAALAMLSLGAMAMLSRRRRHA